jgi:voltage-gated potassium channel
MSGKRNVESILRAMDPWLRFLVIAGTVLYLVEISAGSRGAAPPHPFFQWVQYVLGLVFTIEYVLRWYDDATDNYGWHYPYSPLGLIDLVSILPFWAGLFVPPEWQQMVHTLRVFLLLKFFRYSRSLQLVALGFYRSWPHLKSLGFALLIVGLFCMAAMYEAEQEAQPDKFRHLFDSAYFTLVTVCTVGYGDISPVTITGRIVAMITFMFALSIFAGMLGVLGTALAKVMEEEVDPNVDPIDVYLKERERRLALRAAEKQFGPKYGRERGAGAGDANRPPGRS